MTSLDKLKAVVSVLVFVVTAFIFRMAGKNEGIETERKSWCERYQSRTAFDHCMKHGVDAKFSGDGFVPRKDEDDG